MVEDWRQKQRCASKPSGAFVQCSCLCLESLEAVAWHVGFTCSTRFEAAVALCRVREGATLCSHSVRIADASAMGCAVLCRYYVLRHSLHPLKDVGLLCFRGRRADDCAKLHAFSAVGYRSKGSAGQRKAGLKGCVQNSAANRKCARVCCITAVCS